MPWLQLIFECNPEQAERLSDLLSEREAAAVTLKDGADQPLYEPPLGSTPLWNATRVIGLYPAEINTDVLIEELIQAWGTNDFPAWRAEQLEDKDWSREWMEHFKPMRFGERVWIIPSWFEPEEPKAVNILLDPGLAFGTGTHPTTHLCLEWLDARELSGKQVVDYGCGSGILAIAAALLGAEPVWGVDNDPQALIATRENAERNQVQGHIKAQLPEAELDIKADVLVANILALPLMSLAPRLAELVKAGGELALSGILPEQAEMVSEAYCPWFELDKPVEHDGWIRLQGQRKT